MGCSVWGRSFFLPYTCHYGREIAMKQKLMAVLACLFLLFPATVYAEDRVPDLQNRSASLTVSFVYTQEDGTETGIPGASFSIYKVADLSTQGGSVEWSTLQPYRDTAVYDDGRDVTYDGIDVEKSMALAKADAAKKTSPYASAVTDADGKAVFSIPASDFGMYLIVQNQKVSGFSLTDPFLASVPEAQGNPLSWNYEVTASPKKAAEKEESIVPAAPTPTISAEKIAPGSTASLVKTGDNTDIHAMLAVLLGSTGILIILLAEKHRDGKKENL